MQSQRSLTVMSHAHPSSMSQSTLCHYACLAFDPCIAVGNHSQSASGNYSHQQQGLRAIDAQTGRAHCGATGELALAKPSPGCGAGAGATAVRGLGGENRRRERQRQRHTKAQTKTRRQTETDRGRQRQTETDRDRQRQRQRQRQTVGCACSS